MQRQITKKLGMHSPELRVISEDEHEHSSIKKESHIGT
jgi:hypothetical protein